MEAEVCIRLSEGVSEEAKTHAFPRREKPLIGKRAACSGY